MKQPKKTPPAGTEGVAKDSAGKHAQDTTDADAAHDPYKNIPAELRALPQWVSADAKKAPIDPRKGGYASVNRPDTWGTFAEAVAGGQPHIGFVLTAHDPYVVIDIDDKAESPASAAELAAQRRVLEHFESYTERSLGARWIDADGNERGGYHIVIRGSMHDGRDRGHIGVYGSQRMIVFTGDVVRDAPIVDEQEHLEKLLAEMPKSLQGTDLVQIDGELTDSELHERARAAANGDKYDRLCSGAVTYRDDGDDTSPYKSRSEADLALISILAFYTRDNEQVRRIFRWTALGKRTKHKDSNRWIDRCLKLVRSKETPDLSNVEMQALETLALTAQAAPIERRDLGRPPGLIGDIVDYVYENAQRPMFEAAVLAALGLIAGIAGRCYNINGDGLNLYMLLLASTGRGKSAMAKGIDRLVMEVRATGSPNIDNFMGPDSFSSGPALHGAVSENPSILCVFGEFGLKLRAMSKPNPNEHEASQLKLILDLFNKSGQADELRSRAYADKQKSMPVIRSPALTILGESTPETIYENLTRELVAAGLLPRFIFMECDSPRPPRNREANKAPSKKLIQSLCELVVNAMNAMQGPSYIDIAFEPAAQQYFDEIDSDLDALYAKAEAVDRDLWNRALQNSFRVAGLLAVGVNMYRPVVTLECAQWAVNLVFASAETIYAKFEKGLVGDGESRQEAEAKRVIREYLTMTPQNRQFSSYKVPRVLAEVAGAIGDDYLKRRLLPLTAFKRDRQGARSALEKTLRAMCDDKVLTRISPMQVQARFGLDSVVYAIDAAKL